MSTLQLPQLPLDLTVPICEFLDPKGVYNWMQVSKKHNKLISDAIMMTKSVIEKNYCRFNCDETVIGKNVLLRRAYFDGNGKLDSVPYYPNNLTTSCAITLRGDKCHHPVYMGEPLYYGGMDIDFAIHCSGGEAKFSAHCDGIRMSDLRIYESKSPLHIFDFIDELLSCMYTFDESLVAHNRDLAPIIRSKLSIGERYLAQEYIRSPKMIEALDSLNPPTE